MSVVIRLARAGTKKRPVYHVVVADSRFPRDGRFIERLGHFNPLLPKDNEARLKLDMDKVKAWLAKGAQPSDRVSRFLDAAGVAKRAARNNPEKAVPRKERKARRRSRRQGVKRSGARRWQHRSASPDRRRAWRARRGEAVDVHGRPAGREALRPADDQGRRASVRGRRTPARPRDHLVATLKGIATREEAERLNGVELYVAREKLPDDRRGRILPRRPDRARRGQCRERAARPRHRDPQFRRRRHHRDRAAAMARPCCCRSPMRWCRRSILRAGAW